MIVSWKWLHEYVPLDITPDELARRLMMAGLNHESTSAVGDDLAIDLEITSNRPDCLGHLGIAREAAVLLNQPLTRSDASPPEADIRAAELTRVEIEAPQLCSRYTARLIRGVKIGPSPAWLIERLQAIGVTPINNVVDVTNFVLFECGQPLHAFDFQKLRGGRIRVREPRAGEKIEAIDHKIYELAPGMCVIADAERAVAIGGIMGGATTEVTDTTRDVLLEAAIFDPASIRAAARRLNLHSDSSHRFERGLDPQGVDWASRRACELILELAGGELAAGSVDVGERPDERSPIKLRWPQLKRILGIDIPVRRAEEILKTLGNQILSSDREAIEVIPPSWRRDLTREIDLVEEIARIHGYESIPEDVQVPMASSARSTFDRVLSRVRNVMISSGFDEAYTLSLVEEDWSDAFSPWTDAPAITSSTPVLRRADRLRRSLIPSLLGARRTNESLSNHTIELFEIARIYLSQPQALPVEECMLSFTTGEGCLRAKGVAEALCKELHATCELTSEPFSHPLIEPGHGARLMLGTEVAGVLGELSAAGRKAFDLRGKTAVAELRIAAFVDHAQLVPQYHRPIPYPPVERDLNLVVPDAVTWAEVAVTVREAGGSLLEALEYRDTYRDAERIGAGRKSLLFSITLRDPDGTLTSEQADAARMRIVLACRQRLAGELRE